MKADKLIKMHKEMTNDLLLHIDTADDKIKKIQDKTTLVHRKVLKHTRKLTTFFHECRNLLYSIQGVISEFIYSLSNKKLNKLYAKENEVSIDKDKLQVYLNAK